MRRGVAPCIRSTALVALTACAAAAAALDTAFGAAAPAATIGVASAADPPAVLATPPAPGSLVGAWSFDESSGTTALDSSGRANHGTISGATRSAAGRFGRALSFDGLDDLVTIADAASLDLTTGMTLEAWVRPSAHGRDWRTAVIKEQPGRLAYALYSSQGRGRPSGHAFVGGDRGLAGPSTLPLNTWSHLAVTYDGAALRLYVGGAQVAASALTGPMTTSASPLRIGGNAVWSEWFTGLIDEVRVHDRALTAAQIAADRDTPIATAGLLARSGVKGAEAVSRRRQPTRLIQRAYGRTRRTKAAARRGAVHRTRWMEARRR